MSDGTRTILNGIKAISFRSFPGITELYCSQSVNGQIVTHTVVFNDLSEAAAKDLTTGLPNRDADLLAQAAGYASDK